MSLIAFRARLSGRRRAPGRYERSETPAVLDKPLLSRRLLPVAPSMLAAAILVAYHLVLLWQRLADMSLLQPAVALRWIVTVALLIGLRRMNAAGLPLVWGRRALAFWLLVLLLHVSFLGPLSEEADLGEAWGTSAGLALVLPTAAPLLLIAILVLTSWLAVEGGACRLYPPSRSLTRWPGRQKHSSRRGWLPSLASRPPPAFG